MSRLYINPTIQRLIEEYCKVNSIDDLNAFANRCALQGLSILKFGTSPQDNVEREKVGVKDYDKKPIKKEKKDESSTKESYAVGRNEKEEIREAHTTRNEPKEEGGKQEEGNEEKKTIRRTIKLIKKG